MTPFDLPFSTFDALEILRDATQISLDMREGAHATRKADQTLVTEADRAIEAFLREKLAILAPGWSFLGEEDGLQGDPNAPCWVIDPIDGTTNYAKDLPLWCISIGAVYDGRAVFGMIAIPGAGEELWAAPGQGAFLQTRNGTRKLEISDVLPLQQEDLIASNTTAERVVDFSKVPCRLRNFGSLAYHLTALARGSLIGTIAHYHKIYDVAAGLCICLEAGAEARYLNGGSWAARVQSDEITQPLLCGAPQTLQFLLDALGPETTPEIIDKARALSENN